MLQKRLGRNRLQRPPRQMGEHLLQASPGRQEEEREHRLEQPTLPKSGDVQPSPAWMPLTHAREKVVMVIRHHVPLAVRWAACHELAGHLSFI